MYLLCSILLARYCNRKQNIVKNYKHQKIPDFNFPFPLCNIFNTVKENIFCLAVCFFSLCVPLKQKDKNKTGYISSQILLLLHT